MIDVLFLKTRDGKEISAAYNLEGRLRLGNYWVHPEGILDLYIAFAKGENDVALSFSEEPYGMADKTTPVTLDTHDMDVIIEDNILPLTEFEKLAAYVFKGDLIHTPTEYSGVSITQIHMYQQNRLVQILLNALAPQEPKRHVMSSDEAIAAVH